MNRAVQRPTALRWVVSCEYYTTPPLPSEASAARLLAEIVRFGQCSGDHKVIAP